MALTLPLVPKNQDSFYTVYFCPIMKGHHNDKFLISLLTNSATVSLSGDQVVPLAVTSLLCIHTSACVPPVRVEDAVEQCVAVETVPSSDTAELCDALKASVLCSQAKVPPDILSTQGKCPSLPNQLKEICPRLQKCCSTSCPWPCPSDWSEATQTILLFYLKN